MIMTATEKLILPFGEIARRIREQVMMGTGLSGIVRPGKLELSIGDKKTIFPFLLITTDKHRAMKFLYL